MSQTDFEEFKNRQDWSKYIFNYDESGKPTNTALILARMVHCISYIGVHTIAMGIRTQDMRKQIKGLQKQIEELSGN
jgi:cell division protein FtsB